MALTGNQFPLTLLLAAFCISNADASESKDYRKLVELSFAHLECAAFGMLTADELYRTAAQKSFLQGSMMLHEWLDDVTSGKAPGASVEFVPEDIELMPIPGPPIQFHIGYVWAQVEMQAGNKSLIKSSGWFFTFGESVDQLRRVGAKKQFEKAKCELLQ
jgi:hypothetical protein